MATRKEQVTEPAKPEAADAVTVTEPGQSATNQAAAKSARTYDPRKRVYVYNTVTGEKLADPVPETWLDGRFPQLKETPSKKEGK